MGPPNVGNVEDEYEQPPHFCKFALPEVFFVLTSLKAALFTAIVTAFVLDAMSDLDENTSTKLLRILVEQAAAKNSTIETPPSSPPSSILTVGSLWFLSIMSSLAATTWAILCLEWCAFLTDGVQAEDYEEMAEKRQRRYEAVKRWKMRLVIAAIPLFLHISLFLFLVGLWLRLRDVHYQLGLIVGVAGLIIVSSYVVVTLLPIFTEAPFTTSASELLQPVVGGIRRIVELRHFIHPPHIVLWIKALFPVQFSPRTIITSMRPHCLLRPWMHHIPHFVKHVCELSIRAAWNIVAFLPIVPTFRTNRNPFNELKRLKVGRSDRDEGILLRALFWLMNTPLSKQEVMDILKELKNRNCESLDRAIIRLLVLSLSSVLDNNHISEDEQPIFDHCTEVLAKEMERAFEDGKDYQRIHFQNVTVFEKLTPHFRLTAPSEDSTTPTTASQGEDYWSRAIRALWLCPSQEILRGVVGQLDSDMVSTGPPHLQRIVRGLHAATLAFFNPDQSTLGIMPDFNLWRWDSNSPDPDLDETLSSYLRSIFVAFFNTLQRDDRPIDIPSLVLKCLAGLDRNPEQYTPKLHSALCFFVAVTWRSGPQIFEDEVSVANSLLVSAESYTKYGGEDETRANVLATRLRAIAYGPKSPITKQTCSVQRLGALFAELPNSIRMDPQQCLGGFLDAYAGTLEAVLAMDGHFAATAWQNSRDRRATHSLVHGLLFTLDAPFDFVRENPEHRLPFLYSLAIALHATGERNKQLWKVTELLVTRQDQRRVTLDRALDTNILVVTILKFAKESENSRQESRREVLLESLRDIIMEGTDWRTRWKSIYLISSLVCLLCEMGADRGQLRFLIDAASESFKQVKLEHVPSGWGKKKKEIMRCERELLQRVESLAETRGETRERVYEWIGPENFPYLALYNPQRTTPEPVSQAAYWAVTKLQGYV